MIVQKYSPCFLSVITVRPAAYSFGGSQYERNESNLVPEVNNEVEIRVKCDSKAIRKGLLCERDGIGCEADVEEEPR